MMSSSGRFACFCLLLLGLTSSLGAQAAPQGRAGGPQAASPAASTAVQPDYRIGVEDVLGLVFWREPDMSGDVTVRPDGNVTLPLVGAVKAVGLTPEELKAEIEKAAQKYLTEVNVSVVPRQINSRKVFIIGEVRQPNAYPLGGPRTVLQVIAVAGGLNEYADGEHITIMRERADGSKQTFKFNYKDVTKGKHLETNIQLQPGDTIIVP